MSELNEKVNSIVELYGLRPAFVERHGRVFKVFTDKGTFALKRINASHGLNFLHYIQDLYQRGYNRIVPIYPALDGRYGILSGNDLYYLMPWIENKEKKSENDQKYYDLFRELARVHSLSVREVKIAEDERDEHFEKMNARWEGEQESLEDWLEQSEQQVYMSPFQLVFCTMYSEISGAQRFALNKLNDWKNTSKEETTARTVVVHGKFSPDHFLYNEDGYGYFSNFEASKVAAPIHDLLPFYDRILSSSPQPFDQGVEWLLTYFRYFPFKSAEMHLFLSYLAHPGPVYRIIEKYFSLLPQQKSEMKFIQQIQRAYWRMKNTEYVVMKLDEIEKKKKEETPPSSES